jgi:opacity protein-like surface antigen
MSSFAIEHLRNLHRSAVLAILLVAVAGAIDDTGARWSVVAGGGVTYPLTSDSFQAGLKTGFNVTLGVAFRPSSAFELVARIAHSRFERDDDGTVQHSGILERPVRVLELAGGSMTVNDAFADLRFYPSQGARAASTHPYLLGSMGVASHHYEQTDIRYQFVGHTWPASVPESRDTNVALGVGAGLRFDLGRRIGLLFEGRYQVILRGDTPLRSVPLRVELSMNL